MDHNRKKKDKKPKSKNPTSDEINFNHINEKNDFETVTFDFLEPNIIYSQNVFSLIQKTFSFCKGDVYTLAELICQQREFGIFLSVSDELPEIASDEEDMKMEQEQQKDIYSVLSIIKLGMVESLTFSQDLIKSIYFCCLPENQPKIAQILESKNEFGLLINERVINLPFMVVPSIFDQLMEDRHFIQNCPDYTKEELTCYSYQYLVYFVKSQESQNNDNEEEIESKKIKGETVLYKQEDKVLMKHAIIVEEMRQNKFSDVKIIMLILKYDDFLGLVHSKKLFN